MSRVLENIQVCKHRWRAILKHSCKYITTNKTDGITVIWGGACQSMDYGLLTLFIQADETCFVSRRKLGTQVTKMKLLRSFEGLHSQPIQKWAPWLQADNPPTNSASYLEWISIYLPSPFPASTIGTDQGWWTFATPNVLDYYSQNPQPLLLMIKDCGSCSTKAAKDCYHQMNTGSYEKEKWVAFWWYHILNDPTHSFMWMLNCKGDQMELWETTTFKQKKRSSRNHLLEIYVGAIAVQHSCRNLLQKTP